MEAESLMAFLPPPAVAMPNSTSLLLAAALAVPFPAPASCSPPLPLLALPGREERGRLAAGGLGRPLIVSGEFRSLSLQSGRRERGKEKKSGAGRSRESFEKKIRKLVESSHPSSSKKNSKAKEKAPPFHRARRAFSPHFNAQ